MTFDEFISKYDGKGIDFDGELGNQCMDLYRAYVKEVLNFPQSEPVKGAADVWDKYLMGYYTRINNSPDGIPQKGDIVIWGRSSGLPYGHIAIFIEGTAGSFTSFDQNWPPGSLCHKQGHRYNNVLGWLHPKGDIMPPDEGALKELQERYNKLEEEYKLEQQRVVDCRNDRTDLLTQIDRMRLEFDKERDDLNVRITAAEAGQKAEKEARQEIVRTLSTLLQSTQNWPDIEKAIVGLIGIEDLLNKERKAHNDTVEAKLEAQRKIKELENEVERLEKELKKAKGIDDASSHELVIEVYQRIISRLKQITRR